MKSADVPAVGCPIPEAQAPSTVPTYSKVVAAILQKNCQECHRRGQVGPFPLETYEQARKRAAISPRVARTGRCHRGRPLRRWGSSSSTTVHWPTRTSRPLSAWAEAGAPEGNPARVPLRPTFADDWALGTPDLVIEIAGRLRRSRARQGRLSLLRDADQPGRGPYVSAIEYRPGNRRVVHHMLGYVDTTGEARKRDDDDDGPGYACFSGPGSRDPRRPGWLGARQRAPSFPKEWAASCPPRPTSSSRSTTIPAASLRPTARGSAFIFRKTPIKQTMQWSLAGKFDLKLPPGDSNIEVKAAWRSPRRRRGARRHAPHAPDRPRHAHVGHVPRRPRRRT